MRLPVRSTLILLILSQAVLPRTTAAAPAQDPPPFGWPFGSFNYNVTAAFDLEQDTSNRADWTGWRTGETAGNGHAYNNHGGHDFGMGTSTSLYAPASGRVYALREMMPNNDHSDTGNYLILDHRAATGTSVGGRDYRTRYWHLAQNGVIPGSAGASVSKGSHIANSDNTGNSTGPHLHYGVSLLPADHLTCAFYHGWWQHDEFYTANLRPCIVYLNIGNEFLNCREGNSVNDNLITSFPSNALAVATQRYNWWRVMLPLPPAAAYESRTASGALATGYNETGSWADLAAKSQVVEPAGDPNRVILPAAGSRASTFVTTGDAADTATWNFTLPYQRGLYDIYATWPSDANAAGVTYRVSHSGGTTDVKVDQRGNTIGAGSGTKASPYRVTRNPYVVNHTTVGAQDQWQLYSPQGNTLPQEGPENLYRIDLHKPASITVTVDHTGYPTKDIDLHLLTSPSPSSCIQRANWTMTSAILAAGTYYVACDSYGTGSAGNAAACPYKLEIAISEDHPFPDSWVKLGQFTYTPGANGSVQLRESTVTGKVDPAQPARVVAGAIKVVPRITRRSGWVSDGFATRINTASTPVASVLIKTDATANGDSSDIDEYAEVPIYASAGAGTSNTSDIVGKAVTGQRFVCTGRTGDWYQVWLTNGTAATKGWLLGDHLIGYHLDFASDVGEWSLY